MHDLRHPNDSLMGVSTPLMERNPLLFWKVLCLAHGVTIAILLFLLFRMQR